MFSRKNSRGRAQPLARIVLLTVMASACASEALDDADGGADSGASGAGERPDAGWDAGVTRDAGVTEGPDASTTSDAAVDGGADAGRESDASVDAGTIVDAGPSGVVLTCASDAECAPGVCLVGRCYLSTSATETVVGLDGAELIVAGADADGTLRSLTAVGDATYEVVGAPGAFVSSPGPLRPNGQDYLKTGRQGTARAHFSFLAGRGLDRAAVVDQSVELSERESRRLAHVHHSDGRRALTTLRRVATGGVTVRWPLQLWTEGPSGWEAEEVWRSTAQNSYLLPRFAGADIEIIQTAGFFVYRWYLDATGWHRVVLRTFSRPHLESWAVPRMNDAAGRTHLVLALSDDAGVTGSVVYVEVGSTGITREISLHSGGSLPEPISTTIDRDDEGNVYVLFLGPVSAGHRRSELVRVAPDGTTERTRLASLRTDSVRIERQALSARPDGTLHIYTYAADLPTTIEELTPMRAP